MAKVNNALGKGFDSLLPSDFDTSLLQDERDRIKKVLISDIKPNPDQPRRSFDQQALDSLAVSVRLHGVLQPIIIKPAPNDSGYQIVAGERRYRAAKQAGLESVPAIIRTLEELAELEISLVENVQREDLSSLEQAASIYRLHHQFSVAYEEIAQRLGIAVSTVSNIVRLLQLPSEAQQALNDKAITDGHARAILALAGDHQLLLLNKIIANSLSVRQAEQYVAAQKAGATSGKDTKTRLSTSTPATKKLSTALKAPVSIKRTAKGGKLEIAFKSDDDLERIIKMLSAK